MTRSQLITKVAGDTDLSATEVEKVMDSIFGTITDSLKNDDKVTIAGFGRFEMRQRRTKNFTNPKTKVASKLEPTAIPGFKASGRLKNKVSQ
jgi:DNA-binding protein HU-beta